MPCSIANPQSNATLNAAGYDAGLLVASRVVYAACPNFRERFCGRAHRANADVCEASNRRLLRLERAKGFYHARALPLSYRGVEEIIWEIRLLKGWLRMALKIFL